MKKQISCTDYDYFEIVCMRHSKVVVTLVSEKQISGTAHSLLNRDGSEYLAITQLDNTLTHINLIDIKQLKAIKSPIKQHNFTTNFNEK